MYARGSQRISILPLSTVDQLSLSLSLSSLSLSLSLSHTHTHTHSLSGNFLDFLSLSGKIPPKVFFSTWTQSVLLLLTDIYLLSKLFVPVIIWRGTSCCLFSDFTWQLISCGKKHAVHPEKLKKEIMMKAFRVPEVNETIHEEKFRKQNTIHDIVIPFMKYCITQKNQILLNHFVRFDFFITFTI